MVPISLLLWITLEVAIYLAVARFGLKAEWAYAGAGAIGGVLGMRAGIVAITWMFGMAFASPAPRLGTARTARLMLAEYAAFLFTFIIVLPLERLWMPADRPRPGQLPILLVHGYSCSRGVWWLLRRRLEAAGHSVASISLAPPFSAMGKLEPQLHARIEALCAETGSQQVQLVGHSMGGLICRSYLARHGNQRVSQLITLATPHHGTELARIGFGRNAREMEPNSLWLNDMAGEKITVPSISLRNAYDNYVMPQETQRLPEARDIELPPVGHLAMLYDRQVANLLIACCDEGKNAR